MANLINVTLLQGFITFINSWLLNDFESMMTGPTTALTGWIVEGNIAYGPVKFIQR